MINLLIAIVIILAVLVVVKVIRVFELSTDLKGDNPAEVTESDNKTQATLFVIGILAWLAFVIYGTIAWGPLMLPEYTHFFEPYIRYRTNPFLRRSPWRHGEVFQAEAPKDRPQSNACCEARRPHYSSARADGIPRTACGPSVTP